MRASLVSPLCGITGWTLPQSLGKKSTRAYLPTIMEPRITLPLDILLYIIDLLADDGDIKSLQILSQACKFMVPLCRNHLFSSVHFRSESSSECFSDLLSKNPDIACYVRSLIYRIYYYVSDHEFNVLDMLKTLTID
jgi:hypothetical protein